MSSVCLIDTTVFLILLNVPNCTNCKQDSESVLKNYQTYVELEFTLLLPMATIIETGNHIAQNGNGDIRRKIAINFVENVKATFNGDKPWDPSQFPQIKDILLWIDQFPDLAGKNKKSKKMEGTSFGDLSIIQEFHRACKIHSMREVFIWSLDSDLKNLHQKAK
jgi:hypothetical protein